MDEYVREVDVRKGKQKLGSQVYHNNTTKERLDRVNAAILKLAGEEVKITNKKLAEHADMDRKTVAKYRKIIENKNG